MAKKQEKIDKFILECNKEFSKNGRSDLFIKAENAIISTRRGAYILKFAKEVAGADIEKLTNGVINTNYAVEIFNFAQEIKGINVNKLADAVIKLKDMEYIYYFACYIQGADIEKLQDAIIQIRNAEFIYKFAKDVKNSNLDKLTQAISHTKSSEFIYKFALLDKVDGSKLNNAILHSIDLNYILLFAKDIKGADKDAIMREVIRRGFSQYIYRFANEIEGANLERLTDAMVNIGQSEYIFLFLFIKGVNVDKIVDSIIANGDITYMFRALRCVDEKNIDRLAKIILNSKSIYSRELILEEIKRGKQLARLRKSYQNKYYDAMEEILDTFNH